MFASSEASGRKIKKKAKETLLGLRRFLRYKKDILPAETLAGLEAFVPRLQAINRSGDKSEFDTLYSELSPIVGKISRPDPISENVESIVVAVIIALAIRTYIVQPFRIPTGSMQPSLNGIRCFDIPETEYPGLVQRAIDGVVKGSSYVLDKAKKDCQVVGYKDSSMFLFTRTKVQLDDGNTFTLPCSVYEAQDYMLRTHGSRTPSFKSGQTMVSARIDSGDLVIVDKVSYNFRRPQLGEVFVFDTIGIEGIMQHSGEQAKGQHYIKRLAGLPGDKLQIRTPDLYINGQIPHQIGFERVMNRQAPYNKVGYQPCGVIPGVRTYLPTSNSVLALKLDEKNCNYNQYAALGDNTISSLDSRYWGAVNEFNLVGPGWLCLWPFSSHWGTIK